MFRSGSDTLSKNLRPFIESVPDVSFNCHNLSPNPIEGHHNIFHLRLNFRILFSSRSLFCSFQLVLVEIVCEENTCLNLYGFPEHQQNKKPVK